MSELSDQLTEILKSLKKSREFLQNHYKEFIKLNLMSKNELKQQYLLNENDNRRMNNIEKIEFYEGKCDALEERILLLEGEQQKLRELFEEVDQINHVVILRDEMNNEYEMNLNRMKETLNTMASEMKKCGSNDTRYDKTN